MLRKIDKIIFHSFIFLYLFLLILYSCFLPISLVSAETRIKTVVGELTQDPNFDARNYPAMTLSYFNEINSDLDTTNDQPFMEVIQIAETVNDGLCLYIYQPTDSELDLKAKSVSISLGFSTNGIGQKPLLYDLELLSSTGVFDKYLVKDFNIPNDTYRYYNIISIYREFSDQLDTVVSGGTYNQSISISVGQQWCVSYFNDTVKYEMNTFETVSITPTYVGNARMWEGVTWSHLIGVNQCCDSWFVSFNFDEIHVEKIVNAKLSYKRTDVILRNTSLFAIRKEYSPKEVYLTESDKMTFKGAGLFSSSLEWNRIMSSDSFIETVSDQNGDLTDECEEGLKNGQWVFTFLETPYSERTISTANGHKNEATCSKIEYITVLTISYMDTNHQIYNDVGVVMDKISADLNPDIIDDGDLDDNFDKFLEIINIILAILGVIILLRIIAFFVKLFSGLFGSRKKQKKEKLYEKSK
ncbi:MAG: hypothetical protein E7339_00210 [Clostridiales bacterium]|nr:hypothetical protein [Clostridiales bacterium]